MLTDEQLEIRALAREFALAELRPRSAAWDEQRSLDDEIFGKLAELGFLGMLVPEEHGGLAFDTLTYVVALEELACGDAAVALSVAIHNGSVARLLASYGTPEQRERWLPRMASGEVLGAFALSEPEAGGDAYATATRASRVAGDGWRLDGEKRWVTNGARAGLVVTFARTSDEEVSAFLLEPSSDGYEVVSRESTLGLRASETVGIRLEGVRLGAETLLGAEGDGPRLALDALDVGRIGVAAHAVGVGRAALEHATDYALAREQFDQPIARFGAIEAKLAEMARKLSAGRALAHEAARTLDGTGDGDARTGLDGVTARAAIAKLDASEAATWSADEAIQIYGGYGYMRHYPVEKLLRDAKGAEIYEGANEVMRKVIAREILRDAGA